jgi:hypothetical protein
MAEHKKPKIDLKARLGKKSVGGPPGAGGAIPPPVGIPKPPAMMPGMPGMPGGGPERPRIDASDPYAAIDAQHAKREVAEPKAIKVEMSEEVVEGQKKLMRRAILIGVIISLVMWVIGFAFGDRSRSAKAADTALEGAQTLVKEIEVANAEGTKLADILEEVAGKLGKGEYPEEQISKLGGVNVPFEGANLVGKGINRFKATLAAQVITYTIQAQAANEQKDKLSSVLGLAKPVLTNVIAEKKDPKVHWGVFVMNGPRGPWANMQILPEPFLVNSDKKTTDKDGKEVPYEWPADFKVREGDQEHTLKRYTSGDPVGGDAAKLIPVAPQTESSVCPDSTFLRIRSELADMQKLLKGDQTPGRETAGFMELGEQINAQLRKIGVE